MKIAFIGAGHVGGALAVKLAEAGHEVTLISLREGSSSVAVTAARSSRISVRSGVEAARDADVVFLATPFAAVEGALAPFAGQWHGQVLVDCTNPVGPGLSHGLRSERSGTSVVQAAAAGALVVKAFTIYGFENFEDPSFPDHDLKPAMLFCGDDLAAKARVASLIADVGFEPVDVGGAVQALHLEHMTLLWIRMVRVHGASPHLTWAALRR